MIGRFFVAYVATLPDLVARVGTRVRANHALASDVGTAHLYYVQVDANRVKSLKGPSGLTTTRLQVGIVSAGGSPQDYAGVKQIARLLAGTNGDRRLDGFSGTVTGCEITVQACFLADERDIVLEPQHGEQVGLFEVQQDYEIWWDEAAATVA